MSERARVVVQKGASMGKTTVLLVSSGSVSPELLTSAADLGVTVVSCADEELIMLSTKEEAEQFLNAKLHPVFDEMPRVPALDHFAEPRRKSWKKRSFWEK